MGVVSDSPNATARAHGGRSHHFSFLLLISSQFPTQKQFPRTSLSKRLPALILSHLGFPAKGLWKRHSRLEDFAIRSPSLAPPPSSPSLPELEVVTFVVFSTVYLFNILICATSDVLICCRWDLRLLVQKDKQTKQKQQNNRFSVSLEEKQVTLNRGRGRGCQNAKMPFKLQSCPPLSVNWIAFFA